jgi:hypothetical protein
MILSFKSLTAYIPRFYWLLSESLQANIAIYLQHPVASSRKRPGWPNKATHSYKIKGTFEVKYITKRSPQG